MTDRVLSEVVESSKPPFRVDFEAATAAALRAGKPVEALVMVSSLIKSGVHPTPSALADALTASAMVHGTAGPRRFIAHLTSALSPAQARATLLNTLDALLKNHQPVPPPTALFVKPDQAASDAQLVTRQARAVAATAVVWQSDTQGVTPSPTQVLKLLDIIAALTSGTAPASALPFSEKLTQARALLVAAWDKAARRDASAGTKQSAVFGLARNAQQAGISSVVEHAVKAGDLQLAADAWRAGVTTIQPRFSTTSSASSTVDAGRALVRALLDAADNSGGAGAPSQEPTKHQHRQRRSKATKQPLIDTTPAAVKRAWQQLPGGTQQPSIANHAVPEWDERTSLFHVQAEAQSALPQQPHLLADAPSSTRAKTTLASADTLIREAATIAAQLRSKGARLLPEDQRRLVRLLFRAGAWDLLIKEATLPGEWLHYVANKSSGKPAREPLAALVEAFANVGQPEKALAVWESLSKLPKSHTAPVADAQIISCPTLAKLITTAGTQRNWKQVALLHTALASRTVPAASHETTDWESPASLSSAPGVHEATQALCDPGVVIAACRAVQEMRDWSLVVDVLQATTNATAVLSQRHAHRRVLSRQRRDAGQIASHLSLLHESELAMEALRVALELAHSLGAPFSTVSRLAVDLYSGLGIPPPVRLALDLVLKDRSFAALRDAVPGARHSASDSMRVAVLARTVLASIVRQQAARPAEDAAEVFLSRVATRESLYSVKLLSVLASACSGASRASAHSSSLVKPARASLDWKELGNHSSFPAVCSALISRLSEQACALTRDGLSRVSEQPGQAALGLHMLAVGQGGLQTAAGAVSLALGGRSASLSWASAARLVQASDAVLFDVSELSRSLGERGGFRTLPTARPVSSVVAQATVGVAERLVTREAAQLCGPLLRQAVAVVEEGSPASSRVVSVGGASAALARAGCFRESLDALASIVPAREGSVELDLDAGEMVPVSGADVLFARGLVGGRRGPAEDVLPVVSGGWASPGLVEHHVLGGVCCFASLDDASSVRGLWNERLVSQALRWGALHGQSAVHALFQVGRFSLPLPRTEFSELCRDVVESCDRSLTDALSLGLLCEGYRQGVEWDGGLSAFVGSVPDGPSWKALRAWVSAGVSGDRPSGFVELAVTAAASLEEHSITFRGSSRTAEALRGLPLSSEQRWGVRMLDWWKRAQTVSSPWFSHHVLTASPPHVAPSPPGASGGVGATLSADAGDAHAVLSSSWFDAEAQVAIASSRALVSSGHPVEVDGTGAHPLSEVKLGRR
jgi:hypothetical protein